MNNPEVLKLVDQISQALVLGGPDQEEILQDLPEYFGHLGAMVREMGREDEGEACQSATSLAVQLLDGAVDWAEGMAVLGQTINALQASLSDDCAFEDAGCPPELKDGLAQVSVEETLVVTSVPDASDSKNEEPEGLVDQAIMGEFLTRQIDVLQDVEKYLMNIEDGQEGDETWLLRFYHTLKGESALLGLSEISELCHVTEDTIQKCGVKGCVDQLMHVNDWFVTSIQHLAEDGPEPESLSEILAELKACDAEPAPAQVEAVPEETGPPAEAASAPKVARVEYEVVEYVGKNILTGDVDLLQDFVEEAVEHLDASEAHLLAIESDPHASEALNAVFRAFHTIKGLAGFIELDHVKDLAHKAENLLDMARRGELELRGAYMDAVFESVDMMKRLITDVGRAMSGDGILGKEADLPELMSKLVAMTSGEPAPAPAPEPIPEPVAAETEPFTVPEDEDGKPKISGFVPLGNMPRKKAAPAAPVAAKVDTPAPVAPVAKKDCSEEPKKAAQAPVKVKEAVRVDSERLDRLIETIGELVIAESMVTQSPEIKGTKMSVKLSKDIDHLDKICRELQEIGMSLRMVPVRPVFQKMARLVRDLSKKTGRKVDFVMNGEDTELDKNVVDKIGDPLVHMVRNSVDHGIEPDSADRVAAGKPERGRVELRAFHKGGNICIEIEDDGRGLDKAAILQKAVSRGLVREGENLSDRDIFNMIFEAGFSTAKQVTEVSGRGVGMDVVRRNIEELRGTVDISSEVGKGSVFSIKLPLTLAIIEGMVIVVGQEHYIIPTLSVVRLIRPRPEDITHVFDKGEMLAFEGEHLPLFRLSGLFDVAEAVSSPHEATVVVVEDEGKKIGLMADDLLGQQSIVIKSLGESVQGTDGVAGGAIMSDGNVALILDVAGIVRVAHQVDTTSHVLRSQGLVTATVDRDLGQGAEAIIAPTEEASDVAEENVETGESVQVTS